MSNPLYRYCTAAEFEDIKRWAAIAYQDEPEAYDSRTHHEDCPCEGCVEHFGRVIVRESEGGWGE